MDRLQGTLERVTFYSEETCYLVGRLKVKGLRELQTIVGVLPNPVTGEVLNLQGVWILHPEYGRQFKIEKFTRMTPVTVAGIERYLASGVIKGVGPATAKLLIEKFGKDVLDIIEKEPERLREINGIGAKKAAMITESFANQKEMQQVILFFQEYGISPGYAARIYRALGEKTIPLVREDPYRLVDQVFGIGFKTADMIARKIGLRENSPQRIRASLCYLLSRAAEEGHVYLPATELVARAEELLTAEEIAEGERLVDAIYEQLAALQADREIIRENIDGATGYYLAPLFFAERGVAARLRSLNSGRITLETSSFTRELKEIEKECGVKLAPCQARALEKSLDAGVMVVTGGPGTGKTTTIKALLALFKRFHLEVLLTAPTGRAAKRMAEATGREARTLHRLLEYSRSQEGGFYFKRNEENPLNVHVVIVDEVSMVDILLMYNLLKALPAGCKLILVGDVDQLPSVGPGNVLKDVIDAGAVPVVRLERIFRQAKNSLIIVNAHRVNGGNMPYRENDKEGDFFFFQKEEPAQILDLILDLCSRRLPRYQGFNPMEDIQVLTPMRRTILGVDNLNAALQARLNPPAAARPEVKLGGVIFRLGDRVMQVKNNYDLEVFNGDVGRIVNIDREEGQVIIAYPDLKGRRDVIYGLQEMEEVALAYAISVHKSQGSEYPVVIMPVVTQHFILLQRNLLYTAITRGKKMVIIIGTTKAMAIAVKNNKIEERYTYLSARLKA